MQKKKSFLFPDKYFSHLQMAHFLGQRVDHVLTQNQAQITLCSKSLWFLC